MAKILILTADYFPLHGGIAEYTNNLFLLLQKKHDVNMFVFGINGKDSENIKYINKNKILWINSLKKEINNNYDFIIVSTILPLGWMINLLKVKAKKIFIVYGQEIIAKNGNWFRPSSENILRNADKIISISKFTSSLIPFDSHIFYPLIKPFDCKEKKNHENFIIGSIGRIVKHKNFFSVIKHIKEIDKIVYEKTNKHVKYSIAGTGPLLNEYKDYVKKNNLEDYIVFKGYIENENKYNFYSNIDLLIIPSKKIKNAVEGFGMVVQEAGICKTPSIGYDSGGLKESLEYESVIIQENNEEELKNRIIDILINNNLLKELSKKAFERSQKYLLCDEKLNLFEREILNNW